MASAKKNADAGTVANFLYYQIFTVFGPFKYCLSDNGSHFADDVLERFLALIKVHYCFTTPYYPQGNGMVEKMNEIITKTIKKLAINQPENWDFHLPAVLYSYQTRAHEKIHISPFVLLYGQSPDSIIQDPLQQLGMSLSFGFERLVALTNSQNRSQ